MKLKQVKKKVLNTLATTKKIIMKKILLSFNALLLLIGVSYAQETVYPAKSQKGLIFIKNGTVHVGNGTVIENATIKINNGKIEEVGNNIAIPQGDVQVLDAMGKHVYPGLILPASNLGLQEITGVRATTDFNEIGDMNPSIRSIAAYDADSKITNTLRSNGILLAHTAPGGSLLAGQSSVVQLDAWHWEDAAYKMDNGMHLYLPSLIGRPGGRLGALFAQFMPQAPTDPLKAALDRIEIVKKYFREAKVYIENTPKEVNLKLEAARSLFEKNKNYSYMVVRLSRCC